MDAFAAVGIQHVGRERGDVREMEEDGLWGMECSQDYSRVADSR